MGILTVAGRLRGRLLGGWLRRNAAFSLFQSAVVTVSVFVVYRILIEQVGVARVGIWSLMLAATALMRIGDVSGAGALSRFVAAAMSGRDRGRARDYVHTVIITSMTVNAGMGVALYLIGPVALGRFVDQQYLAEAEKLLPFVVVTMVVGTLSTAVCSAIDGVQRADQRAIVVSCGALVFFLASWLLVPSFGVVGYGMANVLQQVVILGIGWLVLRRSIAELGWFPHRWRRSVFAETTSFALKLQGIAVTNVLFEPLVKFSFNIAGGPGLVVYYDLASRVIAQVRALVIAAATPLVPAFAACETVDDDGFRALLERSTRALVPASIATSIVALAAAPIVSLFVLGALQVDVLRMSAALAFGWGVNILSVSFYFASQARGVLRWNFVGHAVIALSVLTGAQVLEPALGPGGVIASIVIGLVLSSVIVLLGNATVLRSRVVLSRQKAGLSGAIFVMGTLCAAVWALYSNGIE